VNHWKKLDDEFHTASLRVLANYLYHAFLEMAAKSYEILALFFSDGAIVFDLNLWHK
jgi:hypothetical protein